MTYCDHCGERCDTSEMYHFAHLPWLIASANTGESGSLCEDCYASLSAEAPSCRNCDKPISHGSYCSNVCEDMDGWPTPTQI